MTYIVLDAEDVGLDLKSNATKPSWTCCDGADAAEAAAARMRQVCDVKIFKLVEVGHYSRRRTK